MPMSRGEFTEEELTNGRWYQVSRAGRIVALWDHNERPSIVLQRASGQVYHCYGASAADQYLRVYCKKHLVLTEGQFTEFREKGGMAASHDMEFFRRLELGEGVMLLSNGRIPREVLPLVSHSAQVEVVPTHAIDEFINSVFYDEVPASHGRYDVVREEQWPPRSSYVLDVEGWTPGLDEDMAKLREGWPCLQVLLDEACRRGHMPKGQYLVVPDWTQLPQRWVPALTPNEVRSIRALLAAAPKAEEGQP